MVCNFCLSSLLLNHVRKVICLKCYTKCFHENDYANIFIFKGTTVMPRDRRMNIINYFEYVSYRVLRVCFLYFRDVLFKDFVGWLKETTQIELNDTVDLSCSKYEYTGIISLQRMQ